MVTPFLNNVSNDEIKLIYESCFNQVKAIVVQYTGSGEEARDIFHDALIILSQQLENEEFKLTSKISTYLCGIARFKAMKGATKKKRMIYGKDIDVIDLGPVLIHDDEEKQKQRLFATCFLKLGEKCRTLLNLCFEGIKGNVIATQLNFPSYGAYRFAKYNCTNELEKLIQQDDLFKELKK